jgi:short-subunit dehydrogenase
VLTTAADYSASKAGLLAFHASLKAELELKKSNIKTILITPGQFSTRLFKNVKTPSSFLAPVVEPVELGREIVALIDSGMSGELRLPFYTQLVPFLSSLPVSIQYLCRRFAGVDRAMAASIK